MKKHLLLAAIAMLFFSGCSNIVVQDPKQPNEQELVQAFFISNNNLYAISNKRSYRFFSNKVAAFQQFTQSEWASKVAFAHAQVKVQDQEQVEGTIYLFIPRTLISDGQFAKLRDEYRYSLFAAESEIDTKFKSAARAVLNEEQLQASYLRLVYAGTGKIVEVENRELILQRYALPKPITTNISYFITKKDIAGDAKAAATVPLIPIAIIVSIPVMIIWGASCSAHGC